MFSASSTAAVLGFLVPQGLRRWRVFVWLAALSALCGLGVGGGMLYAAWQLNPQCAIHCPELGVAWLYWLAIGISWAVPAFVAGFIVFGVLARIGYAFGRGK